MKKYVLLRTSTSYEILEMESIVVVMGRETANANATMKWRDFFFFFNGNGMKWNGMEWCFFSVFVYAIVGVAHSHRILKAYMTTPQPPFSSGAQHESTLVSETPISFD